MLYSQALTAISRASAFLDVYLQAGEGFLTQLGRMWAGFFLREKKKEQERDLAARLNCCQEKEKKGGWKKETSQPRGASSQQKADFFHAGGVGPVWVQLLA